MSIIWRPGLFSCTGAEFQSDQTLHDGVHLRWMINPQMGLPFELKDRKWGHFRVFEQHSKFPSLEHASLDHVKEHTPVPVHSETDININYRLEHNDSFIYFLRRNQEDSNLPAEQLLNQARSLLSWIIPNEKRAFISYIKSVAREIRGEAVKLQPLFHRAELCAIDIVFSQGTGTVPGGNGSGNPGCLGLLGALAEKKYAWIRAYDKMGHLLAEDWIGRFAFKSDHIKNHSARNKFSIRFRAAGIHHIAIDPVPGLPVMNRASMMWVFCEEYCNAPVWQPVSEEIRFNGNADTYTANNLQQRYYGGFKKTLNWNEAVSILQDEVLTSPDILGFLQSQDTFRESIQSVKLNDNNPDTPGSVTEGSMPLLPVLLHSAADPAVASLLGLYIQLAQQQTIRDIRIVAHAPFFERDNLEILYQEFKEVTEQNIVPYLVQKHLGFFDERRRLSVQLGALVLGPVKGVKPSPPDPGAFTTTVTSVDLPREADTVLLVDSVLKIPVPPFTILPWLNVQAFEVQRRIGEGAFINAAEDDGEDSSLQKLGILPPVYFPSHEEGQSDFLVRDDFMLDLPPEKLVQYRMRSYDIFARPGGLTSGDERNIPLPCHPPTMPANLSASVSRIGQLLWLELFAGLSGKITDLQSRAQTLEIAIHPIDVNAPGAVEEIEWPGILSSRGLHLNYPTSGNFPDPATAVLNCLNLQWNADKVEWSTAAPGSCDSIYPLYFPIVEIVNDPNIDETLLKFRTYRIQLAIADINSMAEGDHRWCSRVRIKGFCDNGAIVYSKESCTGFRYKQVLPPEPVLQPSSSVIPESTFPDKKGNSYFNVHLNPLLSPIPPGGQALVNIYLIDLKHLEPDLSSMVDGNILLAGEEAGLFSLARATRNPFKKMNAEPVPVLAEASYYPVAVEGTLENYYVLGIVGTNTMFQESSWDRAAILLFKTPEPLPKPMLRITGINTKAHKQGIAADIGFRADFESEVAEPSETPVIQLIRHDLNAGNSRFAGQVTGEWHEEGHYYQFDIRDGTLLPWRHYNYEAILLSKAGDKWLKSDQRASGETLAPGMSGSAPLDIDFFAEAVSGAGGNTVKFEFMAGNFDYALVKTFSDNSTERYRGKIINKTITGLEGANLKLVAGGLNFLLQWLDTAGGQARYTLRLSRGQQMPWSNKTNTT
jgi:hypothetical protein